MADVVSNGQIDVSDMQFEASRFGLSSANSSYNPRDDINNPLITDGEIDINDVQYVYSRFDFTCVTPPGVTTSRYMSTADPATLSQEGCAQALAGEVGLVILDFGQPWVVGSTYGAILFDSSATFVTSAQIATAAEAFADGYFACTAVQAPSLSLAIATSNYVGSGGAVTYAHGQAWAQLINQVSSYVNANGYAGVLGVLGASDIETPWSAPADARAWANGYASAAQYGYADIGDAGGCPVFGTGSCSNNWSQVDVWYVAWGAPYADFASPEIYRTDRYQAGQWGTINAVDHLVLYGSITELGACETRPPCSPSLLNWPSYAWAQLFLALVGTAWFGQGSQQPLPWSTDITWAN